MCSIFIRHYWSACKIVRQTRSSHTHTLTTHTHIPNTHTHLLTLTHTQTDSTIRSTATPRNLPYRISDADPAMSLIPCPTSPPPLPLVLPALPTPVWTMGNRQAALACSLFLSASCTLRLQLRLSIDLVLYNKP